MDKHRREAATWLRHNIHRLPPEEPAPDRPMLTGRRDRVLPFEQPPPRGSRTIWLPKTPRERLILEYVRNIIDAMPVDQAWLLERYFLEGLLQSEIAAELELSQQAVSLRLRTALRTFQATMVETGGYPEVAAEAVLRSWQRDWRGLPPADLLDELMGTDFGAP